MLFTRFAVAPLVFLCTTAFAQEHPVPAKEIEETWVGKTLEGTTTGGAAVTMTLGKDGNAQLNAGKTRDTGTWRVWEQGYCTTWRNIRAREERCYTVRRSGGKLVVFNPDGSVSGQFSEFK